MMTENSDDEIFYQIPLEKLWTIQDVENSTNSEGWTQNRRNSNFELSVTRPCFDGSVGETMKKSSPTGSIFEKSFLNIAKIFEIDLKTTIDKEKQANGDLEIFEIEN